MINQSNKELLVKYKRLCRTYIYAIQQKINALQEISVIEKELMERFKKVNLYEDFKLYQGLVFNPPDALFDSNEVLDEYYTKIIDLERKLSL